MSHESSPVLPRPVLAAAVIVPALIGLVLAMMLRTANEAQVVTVLDNPRPLPSVQLTTGDGSTADVAAPGEQWRLLFFGFTHCPDICPTTLQEMAQMRAASAILQARLRPEFVTVDPDRDDAETMQRYAAFFDPAIGVWTGSQRAIRTVADAAGIAFLKVPLDGGGYTMDHSAALVLVNPNGAIAGYVLPPYEQARLIDDLEALVRS